MCTGASRWTTMWLVRILGSVIWAFATEQSTKPRVDENKSRENDFIFCTSLIESSVSAHGRNGKSLTRKR
jgi:hypothetical protein